MDTELHRSLNCYHQFQPVTLKIETGLIFVLWKSLATKQKLTFKLYDLQNIQAKQTPSETNFSFLFQTTISIFSQVIMTLQNP